MNLRDLWLRVRALASPRRVEDELDEELAFHIERETQKQIAAGLSPADARARARARFGPVPLAADQCRDARGTAGVDALARDIVYAFRAFRRTPLAAATIVATVGLGLGLITVVFTVYNVLFLRTDAVRNPGELFEVTRHNTPRLSSGPWMSFTRPQYEALRRETRVFTDAAAVLRGIDTRVDGRRMSATLVTGNFFQVVGVSALLGRTLTPADDERSAGAAVIVLGHGAWTRLFPDDSGPPGLPGWLGLRHDARRGYPTAIGRRVRINGQPYQIVGVMPEDFRGLGVVTPDYWAPLALVGEFRRADAGRQDAIAVGEVIGRLAPGMSQEEARTRLTAWASARTDFTSSNSPFTHIRLTPSQGTLWPGFGRAEAVFSPLFFAFGLILMIGCANVANLLLARGVARQREIGVRLSLGASRGRIVRQLLTESLLLALAAAACGFAVSRLFLLGALHAAASAAPPELAELMNLAVPAADWRVLLFLVAGAIVSTVFFALVPALQATRLELVRTMRGEITKDAPPGRARNVLIAVQVGASALLLICAAVFLRSASAATTADPGLRTSDTVMVPIVNEPLRAAILQQITAHPSVALVAASSPAVDRVGGVGGAR